MAVGFVQSAAIGAPVAAQTKNAKAAAANPAGAKGGGRAGATPDAAKAIATVDLHREQAEKVRPRNSSTQRSTRRAACNVQHSMLHGTQHAAQHATCSR